MEQNDKLKESKMALNGRLFLLVVGLMLIFNGVTSSGRNGLGWVTMAKALEDYRSNHQETADSSETIVTEEESAVVEAGNIPESVEKAQVQDDGKETEIPAGQDEGAAADTLQGADGPEETDTSQGTADPEGTASSTDIAASQETPTDQAQEADLEALIRQIDETGIAVQDLRIVGIFSFLAMFFEIIVGLLCAVFSNRVDKSKITLMAVIALIAAEIVCMVVFFLKGALSLSMLINAVLLPLLLLWSATRLRKLAEADPKRIYAVQPSGRSGNSNTGENVSGGTDAQQKIKTEKKSASQKTSGSIREKAMWTSQLNDEENEENE